MSDRGKREEQEDLPLPKAAEYLLEECRMVLPGIQALFGFQLVAVFSAGFGEKLSAAQQRLHLIAIILVVIAIALIMTPAAYHREIGGRKVTETFLTVSTRLVIVSMVPLALALSIDFYLVASVIVEGIVVPILAALVFAVLIGLWFILPRWQRLLNLISR